MHTKFGVRSQINAQQHVTGSRRTPAGFISRRLGGKAPSALTALVAGGLVAGCLDRPIGVSPPVTTNIFVDKITQTSVDKIDLLFMIDNSGSMSDKQEILRLALPDLVQRLVDPVCVNSEGVQGAAADANGQCETGFTREFNPIEDINIAVVTSSLGDVGANSTCQQGGNDDVADMAHTVGSLNRGAVVESNDMGFLEWRPGTDLSRFASNFDSMVGVVGEAGCGWEASLESWYRFLVDPFPYRALTRVPCSDSDTDNLCVQQTTDGSGVIELDEVLLAQRNAFLRDDSLLAIIMLTDENDCSMQVGNQTWVVASNNVEMYRGTSACDTNPNSPCCHICAIAPPDGCEADPICNADPATGAAANRLPRSEDALNLRCFQQKRRFGLDFLHPTQRYVNALSQFQLCWSRADLSLTNCDEGSIVNNPLYPEGGRSQSLVFLGGIIGVPYQSIASDVDANGQPLEDPSTQLRFKTWEELTQDDDWSKILGDVGSPANSGLPGAGNPPVPPTDVFMVESAFERPGIPNANPVNGRDWDTTGPVGTGAAAAPREDLQYSCIFPLLEPRDCSSEGGENRGFCDCEMGDENKPLCEAQPGVSAPGNTQYWAKAYPGTRQLEVLEAYGSNSIVASICARNIDDDTRSDFGYRPAVAAIVDRLKEQLADRCLPRPLQYDESGVPCTLVETVPRPAPGESCECNPAQARRVPTPEVDDQIRGQLAVEEGNLCGPDDPDCTSACLCEVLQVQQVETNPANALEACQNDESVAGVQGWCYVSPDDQIGNPVLVENCSATERRKLRFVGQGLQPNTTTYVSCNGSSLAAQQ